MENKTVEELRRQSMNKYYRKWRSNNKDKVKKYNHDYWAKKAIKQQVTGEGKADLSEISFPVNPDKEVMLNQMIEEYITNKNKKSIEINSTETTVTSLRLNKELYKMIKDRAAAEKIGITDLMNNIMLNYLNDINE